MMIQVPKRNLKKGDWLKDNFPHGGDHTSKVVKSDLAKMQATKDESAAARATYFWKGTTWEPFHNASYIPCLRSTGFHFL